MGRTIHILKLVGLVAALTASSSNSSTSPFSCLSPFRSDEQGCNGIRDKRACLSSRDGRQIASWRGARIKDEPCIWCADKPCTTESDAVCEAEDYLNSAAGVIVNPSMQKYFMKATCPGPSSNTRTMATNRSYSTHLIIQVQNLRISHPMQPGTDQLLLECATVIASGLGLGSEHIKDLSGLEKHVSVFPSTVARVEQNSAQASSTFECLLNLPSFVLLSKVNSSFYSDDFAAALTKGLYEAASSTHGGVISGNLSVASRTLEISEEWATIGLSVPAPIPAAKRHHVPPWGWMLIGLASLLSCVALLGVGLCLCKCICYPSHVEARSTKESQLTRGASLASTQSTQFSASAQSGGPWSGSPAVSRFPGQSGAAAPLAWSMKDGQWMPMNTLMQPAPSAMAMRTLETRVTPVAHHDYRLPPEQGLQF